MTKAEVIKSNKAKYELVRSKLSSMQGLEKLVAQELVLAWIKGTNWIGGMADSKFQKIYDRKFAPLGYSDLAVCNEFEKQILVLS